MKAWVSLVGDCAVDKGQGGRGSKDGVESAVHEEGLKELRVHHSADGFTCSRAARQEVCYESGGSRVQQVGEECRVRLPGQG